MAETRGKAQRGSRLQIQLYVNRRPDVLSHATAGAFPELRRRGASLRWVAPLERDDYVEPRDGAFLAALGLQHLAGELARFWPLRGPVWDALARVEPAGGGGGALLVEAKSYPEEFYSRGTQAASRSSLAQIREALARTQRWLGVEENPGRWMFPLHRTPRSSLYQSANRYAHLYFLREVAGIEAWLVHVLFLDDPTHVATTRERWEATLPQIEAQLGLAGVEVPGAGHVFLPGRRADELA